MRQLAVEPSCKCNGATVHRRVQSTLLALLSVLFYCSGCHYETFSSADRCPELMHEAETAHNMGHDLKAEQCLKEALQSAQANKDHRQTAKVLRGLADLYCTECKFTDAESMARREIEQFEALYSESNSTAPDRFDAQAGKIAGLEELATVLTRAGRPQEALEAYKKALQFNRANGGNVATTLRIKNAYSSLFRPPHKVTKAEKAFAASSESAPPEFEEHIRTAGDSWSGQIKALAADMQAKTAQHDLVGAEKIAHEMLRVARQDKSEDCGSIYLHITTLQLDQNHFAQAIATAREALNSPVEWQPADRAALCYKIATSFLQQKNLGQTKDWLVQARASFPDDRSMDRESLNILFDLAQVLAHENNLPSAESTALSALAQCRRLKIMNESTASKCMIILARIDMLQKKNSQADAWANSALNNCREMARRNKDIEPSVIQVFTEIHLAEHDQTNEISPAPAVTSKTGSKATSFSEDLDALRILFFNATDLNAALRIAAQNMQIERAHKIKGWYAWYWQIAYIQAKQKHLAQSESSLKCLLAQLENEWPTRDSILLARALFNLGRLQDEEHKYAEAESTLQIALKTYDQSHKGDATLLESILSRYANVLFSRERTEGSPTSARVIGIGPRWLAAESKAPPEFRASLLWTLAILSWRLGKTADAIGYLTKDLSLLQESPSPQAENRIALVRAALYDVQTHPEREAVYEGGKF